MAWCQNNNKAAMKQFQERYDGLTKATLAKDIAKVSTFLADDYNAGDTTHPMNKQKALDGLRHSNERFKTTSRKAMSVIVNGKKASVIAEMIASGHLADKAGDHLFVIRVRSMDTWVQHSAWQLKNSRVIQKAMTKDGKMLKMQVGQ